MPGRLRRRRRAEQFTTAASADAPFTGSWQPVEPAVEPAGVPDRPATGPSRWSTARTPTPAPSAPSRSTCSASSGDSRLIRTAGPRSRDDRGPAASDVVIDARRHAETVGSGRPLALVGRAFGRHDVQHGVDQGQVGEGLREVAEVAPAARRRAPRRRGRAGSPSTAASRRAAGRGRARRSGPSADTSQNEQMVKVPSSPDKPVVGLLDAVAQHEAVVGQLVGDGAHGGDQMRGSSGGRKPTSGMSSTDASSAVVAVVLREDAAFVDAVGAARRRGSRRRPPARLGSALVLVASPASRAPRSTATQHIIFEL